MSRLLAEARVRGGPHDGKSLRVWPAGQMRGDLGDPRLNQRAALYAEAILDKASKRRPERHRKTFEGHGGRIEIEFQFLPEDSP